MSTINNILVQLAQKLATIKGNWMLIGTASLYLAGYPVVPNDIDILTDAATAKEIEQLLAAYNVASQVKPSQKFRSVFSQYIFYGFSIEVMGDLEVNSADGWVLLSDQVVNPQTVVFQANVFTVPSKQDQIAIYTLFNRAKDEPVLQMLAV
ncbi:nucleotidyltransferase domain-containing protein [Mucilaginibacter sp. AW1-3]